MIIDGCRRITHLSNAETLTNTLPKSFPLIIYYGLDFAADCFILSNAHLYASVLYILTAATIKWIDHLFIVDISSLSQMIHT